MPPTAQNAPTVRAAHAEVTAPMPVVEAGGLAEGFAAGRRRPAATNIVAPEMGTFTPVNSKYYVGTVIDPISGTHYDASSGTPTQTSTAGAKPTDIVFQWDDNQTGTFRQILRFTGVFLGILVLAGLLAHMPAMDEFTLIPLILAQLAGGLLLPVMKVVPWQDEDGDDAVWFLILTLIFGPAIGLVVYGVKAVVLQEYNTAIIGLFIVSLATYTTMQLASPFVTGEPAKHVFSMLQFAPPWTFVGAYGVGALFISWAGMIALVGWFAGNVFHKFDE